MLVDNIGCEAKPSREETCLDCFEPCYLRGSEAGSMAVPDNMSLGCSVVDAVCGMAIGLLFSAKIPDFVNHEVLTDTWWRRPSVGCCG